jgi:hypothetical protein
MVHMGIDFDSRDPPTDVNGVAALNPVVSGPVWSNLDLNIPCDRIMKGKWMYTFTNSQVDHKDLGSGFALATSVSGQTEGAGEVWLEYEIEFCSPTISKTITSAYAGNVAVSGVWKSGAGPEITNGAKSSGQSDPGYLGGILGYLSGVLHGYTDSAIDLGGTQGGDFLKPSLKLVGLDPSRLYEVVSSVFDSTHPPTFGKVASQVLGKVLTTVSSNASGSGAKQSTNYCVIQPNSEGNCIIDYAINRPTDDSSDWVFNAAVSTLGAAIAAGVTHGLTPQ